MQKVKVQRYISGKRPEYAQYVSSDEESDEEDFSDRKTQTQKSYSRAEEISLEISRLEHSAQVQGQLHIDDPRLRRLQQVQRVEKDDDDERLQRHRHIHEPEIVESEEESEPEEETTETVQTMRSRRIALGSDSETDTELSDTEIEERRQRLRQKMMQQRKEEEVLMKEEEKSESSEEESSEYEEETESEEDNEPRMKPLFVRKRDRATIAEKEKEAVKQRQLEYEAKKMAKERRRQTLKLVEDSVKKDLEKAKPDSSEPNIDDVCTDDENDEVEYESWKLRELKRIKRDREEKEAYVIYNDLVIFVLTFALYISSVEREKLEVDRLRNMTEEERRQELRQNPKTVTNKAAKGKYKFLQKYFHRGAFYLDEEDDVLKRDFAQATLEDHFDKTILPKVMQVKNFGRCGRTKYTHLVDQDTTQFDSPWYCDTANNIKFHSEKAGGMKQVFDKPTLVKRKKMS